MRWERTLPYGVPPFLWDQPARCCCTQSVPCLLFVLAWGVPPLLVGHAMRWERMLPYRGGTRGVPPFALALSARRGLAWSPPPLLPARGLCARLGQGVPILVPVPVCRGVLRWYARGPPSLPPLRASGARCWVGGSPPPSSPPRPLALGAGCRSGEPIVNVRPASGPRAQRARWGPPSGSQGPPRGGFSCWASRGSPLGP